MSSFKKNSLAAALVLGLGLTGSAAAYTYWTSGDTAPEKVANFAFDGTTTQTYTMTEDVEFRVDPADLIVGRTTGFTVRFGINNATIATPLSTAAGAYNGDNLPAGWIVTVAFQNSNTVVFNVIPPDGGTIGISPGEIIQVPGLTLSSVEELATSGGQITALAFFADSVSATELGGSRKNFVLLESGNPLTRACNTDAGDVSKRIDVADTSASGGYQPKTAFSADGSIGGSATSGAEASEFDFGDYSVGLNNAFSFQYQAGDQFVSTMTGPNSFESFTSIYLSTDDCATSAVAGVIVGNDVTFDYGYSDVNATPDGFTVAVCGTVDNSTVILDNDPINISTVATRGVNDVNLPSCSLLPLKYNGSIVKVYNFNPAGVSSAESFLRVINPSTSAGLVTIVAWDDNGNYRGPVTFTLAPKNSRQLNSGDLENGNPAKAAGSFGDGVGKWRFEVTGEFPGMRVSSLNRNNTDGTVTDLTDADGHGEQRFNELFDNQ